MGQETVVYDVYCYTVLLELTTLPDAQLADTRVLWCASLTTLDSITRMTNFYSTMNTKQWA